MTNNLNWISHDSAINLIKKIKDNLKESEIIEEVFLDTVGDVKKYQDKLKQHFNDIKITVSKKADSIYPIVSAASIFAKVERDMVIKSYKLDLGSGYPR